MAPHLIGKSNSTLPVSLTATSWLKAHAHLRDQYLKKHHPGVVMEASGSKHGHASRVAHEALMEGDYGVPASVPCRRCTRLGLTCRVYHSKCYKWDIGGRNASSGLGWRCNNCRLSNACVFSDGEEGSTLEPDDSSTTNGQLFLRDGMISIRQDASENPHGRNQFSPQLQNVVSTRLRDVPLLPASITRETWQSDLDAARQKYLDKHNVGTMLSRTHRENSNRCAHQELIRGKYGIRAAMACEYCSDRERECRTYHPQCYQWTIQGKTARDYLGWRCADCRYQHGHEVGCNVQWE